MMAWIHINIRDASELTHLRNLKRNRAVIDVSALPGNFTHINAFCACFSGPHKASSSQEAWKELSHRDRFMFSVCYKCLFSQLSPAVGSFSLWQKEIIKKIYKSFFLCIILKDLPGKYLGGKKKPKKPLCISTSQRAKCIYENPTQSCFETRFSRLKNLDSNISLH